MASKMITTHEMEGMRVFGGKSGTKRIGKVRRVVFHPTEKRVVGFIVKRPDLLWMFRRKDKFVSIDGFDLVDGRMVVHDDPEATDQAACQALGVDYDSCVLWLGLPVMTADGQAFGVVGNVDFNVQTGMVESFTTDSGAANNAILGKRVIPAEHVMGFRRGMGTALKTPDVEDDQVELGAILVSNDVKALATEGGMAEAAGKATAVAAEKVHETVDKGKEVASAAAKKTGEAVNKGAYATGKQISKSKTMFSDFKKEYDKAVASDEPKKAVAKTTSTSASEAPRRASSKAASEAGAPKKVAAKKPAAKKQAKPKKNMFSAFKDEYDKARHD